MVVIVGVMVRIFYAKHMKMHRRSLIILMKRLDEQYLLPVFMIQKKIREWDM
nr:MAG TPA_asm: hypothetical protein [Bacteriophage sp.]